MNAVNDRNEVERMNVVNERHYVEPHIYIMRLKKILKKQIKRSALRLLNKIYVVFDTKTMMPESIELHYASEELENEYSFKGSQVLHRLYKFPKTPLKFYKELTAETPKLVLIYDNWRSKWQVNECKQE